MATRTDALLETTRVCLRLPTEDDYEAWRSLRFDSAAFLTPWEPAWPHDYLHLETFLDRVAWGRRAMEIGEALPLFMIRKADRALLGGITLDSIRRGPLQTADLGFWIGAAHARRGYMREAIASITEYAFDALDIGRLQAACLPENTASKNLLEKSGFTAEGLAKSYMQIAGTWRDHVLYAKLRRDRTRRAAVR